MKRMLGITVLTLFVTTLAVAQAKPPAISDALKAQFFKAQSQMVEAQAQFQQAQQQLGEKRVAFQQAIESLKKDCGEGFEPQMDKQGDPACVVKPKTPPHGKK